MAPCKHYMGKKLSFLIIVILITALFWPIFPSLKITSNESQQVLWIQPIDEGETFTIRFTHSVARTDVDEVIRIGKDKLIIDSTIYESFGAGLPFDLSGNEVMTRENGKIKISNINRAVTEIDLRIGQVVANHRLIYRDRIIPLKELSPQGSSVRFELSKQNIIQKIGRELMDG